MSKSLFSLDVALSVLAAMLFIPAALSASDAEPPAVDFRRDIRPILEAKCYRCHDAKKQEGRLDMSTREKLLKGGSSGPALVPGNVEKSLMMDLVEFGEMPPPKEKQPVTQEEFAKLSAWIKQGATMPDEEKKN